MTRNESCEKKSKKMTLNIARIKSRKPGIDADKQCAESRAWMRITKTMRETGEYSCSACGRRFKLGAAERVHPSNERRVPVHIPKKGNSK